MSLFFGLRSYSPCILVEWLQGIRKLVAVITFEDHIIHTKSIRRTESVWHTKYNDHWRDELVKLDSPWRRPTQKHTEVDFLLLLRRPSFANRQWMAASRPCLQQEWPRWCCCDHDSLAAQWRVSWSLLSSAGVNWIISGVRAISKKLSLVESLKTWKNADRQLIRSWNLCLLCWSLIKF